MTVFRAVTVVFNMENPGGDGGQELGPQHEQFGMPFRGVAGMEAYCGNVPSSSSACVPGLLRLSQSSASGISVPTYSEMQASDPLAVGSSQPLQQQQHDLEQHGDILRKVPHPAPFSDVRHSEMTTSDEDGSISGKFTVPQSSASPSEGHSAMGMSPQTGKKTKGRVKIKMEYIDNKLRRYTTFSKRKTGIMKKASLLCFLCYRRTMFDQGWIQWNALKGSNDIWGGPNCSKKLIHYLQCLRHNVKTVHCLEGAKSWFQSLWEGPIGSPWICPCVCLKKLKNSFFLVGCQ